MYEALSPQAKEARKRVPPPAAPGAAGQEAAPPEARPVDAVASTAPGASGDVDGKAMSPQASVAQQPRQPDKGADKSRVPLYLQGGGGMKQPGPDLPLTSPGQAKPLPQGEGARPGGAAPVESKKPAGESAKDDPKAKPGAKPGDPKAKGAAPDKSDRKQAAKSEKEAEDAKKDKDTDKDGKPAAKKPERAGADKAGADKPAADKSQSGEKSAKDQAEKADKKAKGKPSAGAEAAAGEGAAAGAGAGPAAAAGQGGGGAGGEGGEGGGPVAAGGEAAAESPASQDAEAHAEEKMESAEPETQPGESSAEASAVPPPPPPAPEAQQAAGGAPAPAAAEQAGGDAEGGGGGAPPEAAGEESDSGGGGADAGEGAAAEAEPPAPEPKAAAPEAAAQGASPDASAPDPEAAQRQQDHAEQREQHADTERVSQGASEEREQEQAEQDAESSGAGAAPSGPETELSGPERGAALGSLGEELPAEGGGGGGGGDGGGGGGAADAKQDETPPDVSGMPPEQGLATLSSATPAQADAALGGVESAAARDNADQTASVQESLPETTIGEPAAGKAAAPKGQGAAGASTQKQPAAGPAPKAKPAPTPTPKAGNAADKVARPNIPKPAEGAEPSEADKARLVSSLSALPTGDPGLKVRLGDAPTVQLSGDADPARMASQKAKADQAVAAARAKEAAEVAKPMGEQNVRPTVGIAEIKARAIKPAAGAGGGAAGGGGGGGAGGGDAARGILAEELKGNDVRAAMSAASAKASAAKADAQAKVAASNAEAQAQIGELKTQAATSQEAARNKVRADAAAARGAYAQKQEAAVQALEKKQSDTLAKTNEKVSEEKRKGDEEAAAQIEEGDKQTAEKEQEVETEVAEEKKEAQAATEEKGFFGRLADDVGAWFDKQKKWISDKVEAGKKWIKETADKFKKYAAEKIDAARDKVTGFIKDAGDVLIAASDTLLADFPAARDAVRGTIESGVEWGVNKTNELAEDAKKEVNKRVDQAAAVAEFALETGGKVATAAIDGAKKTTVDALNAADKAAQALGVLKVLVEDVAADPGGWISKLGASAKDGVKNHLAAAMKAAIKQWWEGKLESVLGVGPAMWETLKKGGLGLKEIGAMAWSAIKAAIPPALIQLIIEKVVSMIIPAAGAVMAIIEGLQAAWGSVSAILGAVGKAIAFLKAVKGGGAGPQFAQLVAAAAIVVIDFVSNWLLAKLGKAILKIGGKIKGIAQKILKKISGAVKKMAAKRKAKKAKAKKKKDKKARDKRAKQLREERKKKRADKDGKKKDDPNKKQKDKKDDKAARLRKAVEAIRPQLQKMAAKGKVSGLLVKAKLLFWRARYRLSKLALQGSGDNVQVIAQINPSENVVAFVKKHGAALRKVIYEVAEELFQRDDVRASMKRLQADMDAGKGSGSAKKNRLQVNSSADSVALAGIMRGDRAPGTTHVMFAGGGKASVSRKEMFPNKENPKTSLGPGNQLVNKGGDYIHHPSMFDDAGKMDTMKPVDPGRALTSMSTVTMAGGAGKRRDQKTRDFAARQALLRITEMSRSDQAFVVSSDLAQQVGTGRIEHREGLARDPMTGLRPGERPVSGGSPQQQVERGLTLGNKDDRESAVKTQQAVADARTLDERTRGHQTSADMTGDVPVRENAAGLKRMIDQQIRFIATVMEARYGAENVMFNGQHGLMEAVRKDVKDAVRKITEQNLGLPPER